MTTETLERSISRLVWVLIVDAIALLLLSGSLRDEFPGALWQSVAVHSLLILLFAAGAIAELMRMRAARWLNPLALLGITACFGLLAVAESAGVLIGSRGFYGIFFVVIGVPAAILSLVTVWLYRDRSGA